MRSDPREYELVAPASLQAALALLGQSPAWLPIAGGTDIMVLYAAGKLPSRRLVSIWKLPELRRIEVLPDEIRVGAACTYTEIREHEVIGREFPMLARAAAWTGGIANQNRGTLGGNIVNASPAADSLPALLAYDAELILVSVRGERRLPYAGFHTDYKKTRLAAGELIRSVCLPRKFLGYVSHARKVGSRNAQAISKVCVAALGRVAGQTVEDVRISIGSVAPVPLRLSETERIVTGKGVDESLVRLAKKTAIAEIRPIDDIRSTAKYRTAVAANLVAEFLSMLRVDEQKDMSDILAGWNVAPLEAAATQILPCCGSRAWALKMAARRPFRDEASLATASDETWCDLTESDWMEAFRSHPRVGESSKPSSSTEQSAVWSVQEQKTVGHAEEAVKIALAAGNREYEQKFGCIFIVCATGRSVSEILNMLRRRLQNDAAVELQEAAEEQRQITQIRLRKWLQG